MSKITSIKAHKNHLFSIYIDDLFFMKVHEDVIVQQNLKKGDLIEEDNLKKIIDLQNYAKAKHLSLYYISSRMKTKKEVQNYLLKKEFNEKIIEDVITFLEKHEFVNDERFAKLWVESRINSKKNGLLKIKQELYQKGINNEIISYSIESFKNDDIQIENAIDLAKKKIKSYEKDDFLSKKRKLYSFLCRKGYSSNIALKAINFVLNKNI